MSLVRLVLISIWIKLLARHILLNVWLFNFDNNIFIVFRFHRFVSSDFILICFPSKLVSAPLLLNGFWNIGETAHTNANWTWSEFVTPIFVSQKLS